MHVRAQGPAKMQCIVDEGDPVVLTDATGTVIVGPSPAPPAGRMVFDYNGPRVADFCWGVLNPDGTLAFQSELLGPLYQYQRINLDLETPGDEQLTSADRKWLDRMRDALRS